ncbi:MAG: radical SAM family heme chaperone HemW [Desulfomonilaceae bacterium]
MPAADHCGLYLHIPFCASRCAYCAFVTFPFEPTKTAQYVEALGTEAVLWSSPRNQSGITARGLSFDSIYLGGGTPSVLSVTQIEQLLAMCVKSFSIVAGPEITIEANPDSCTREWLIDARNLGVNRVSLGVQSFNDAELRALGRSHDAAAALRAYRDIRDAGFDNVSIDLIAGFPGHGLPSFEQSLRSVARLAPEHVSVYLFELKEGSTIHHRVMSGELSRPDDDLAADLYELCCAFLTSEGYIQYEISNFSKEGFECRHNLKYWMDMDYVGLGAGAHGLIGEWRYANTSQLDLYLECISQGELPRGAVTRMTRFDRFRDALIMCARRVRGVDLGLLGRKYGVDAAGFVRKTLAGLDGQDLFELTNNIFRFTQKGRLLSNQVFNRWV